MAVSGFQRTQLRPGGLVGRPYGGFTGKVFAPVGGIYGGSNLVTKIFHGSSPIWKAYKASSLVWPVEIDRTPRVMDYSAASGAGSFTITPTLSGANVGNLLVLACAGSNSPVFSVPTGFVSELRIASGNGDIALEVFFKEAVGGETSLAVSGDQAISDGLVAQVLEINFLDFPGVVVDSTSRTSTGSGIDLSLTMAQSVLAICFGARDFRTAGNIVGDLGRDNTITVDNVRDAALWYGAESKPAGTVNFQVQPIGHDGVGIGLALKATSGTF